MHPHDIAVAAIEAQVLQQKAEKLAGITLRLKQESAVDASLPPLEQLKQERGLAHSGLSDDRDKAAARFDSIE
jgi:hypothetical protein